MSVERYIERSFPIVQLNPLSVRERNAFKPVYKMHKWFARRSASIFRAILLASALPYEEDGEPVDLMKEFYEGHGDDPRLRRPDGTPLRVLDPFMGGGTTVVEALRLGFDVTGIDLNPIAWFIVKGETTPVDLDALDAAFERVANKVRDDLLELYKTTCPLTGKDADIIYGFWVKQGHCAAPGCDGVTDLFKSYEVARKRGDASIKYVEATCPHCKAEFDWELDRCTITAGGPQVPGDKPAGKKRPPGRPYVFGRPEDGAACPNCEQHLLGTSLGARKPKRKKVPLRVVIDPTTGDFFEVRGGLPDEVVAPLSGHAFDPKAAPAQRGGKFVCAKCGLQQAIVEAADALGRPLPFRYYGYYAYSPHAETDALETSDEVAELERSGLPTNNAKFFATVDRADLERVEAAQAALVEEWDELPLPTQPIPTGRNFRDLLRQGYRQWSDVYGPRHLLALGRLLSAISEEPDQDLRDALLAGFKVSLGCMSQLAIFNVALCKVERVNSAHDFRNPTTTAEGNVWGLKHGRGSFISSFAQARAGKDFEASDYEWLQKGEDIEKTPRPTSWGRGASEAVAVSSGSAASIDRPSATVDLVITDPPYAGSVQYAEMSDWYYVWLHHVLKDAYPEQFGPELTLKAQEIIEDQADKDADWYFDQLTEAWRECHRVLTDDGLLVFTFHHREGDRWTGLLRSLFEAGFYLIAAYPTHSEALNSIVIQATKGITYDIVHVCRKRPDSVRPIPWPRLRREVQKAARQQLAELEASGDVLPGPDVWMILLGKALQLFSQHYGKVLDQDGKPLDLDEAMDRIRVMVAEIRGDRLPLPPKLHDADSLSQVALLLAVGDRTYTRDGLHIELQGYAHQPEHLEEAGLVSATKSQVSTVPVLERVANHGVVTDADGPLIDKLHWVLAETHAGRGIERQLRQWHGHWDAIVEGLNWIAKHDTAMKSTALLAVRSVEALGPDEATAVQLDLL